MRHHVFNGIKDYGAAGVAHEFRRGSRLLDDGSARRKVAVEHGHGAFLLERRGEVADDILAGSFFGVGDHVADCASAYGGRAEVEKRAKLAHERRHAARVMEMLHVVRARGLDVDEHGNFASQFVECIEVEWDAGAASHGDEVDETVGRSADGLQNYHSVTDGCGRDEIARPG